MNRYVAVTALIFAGLMLPLGARADVIYTFTTNAGSFSLTEPSLITTAQALSFTPFTFDGVTITQGFVGIVSGGSIDCFSLATPAGSVGNCSASGPASSGAIIVAFNATSQGTVAAGFSGFGSLSNVTDDGSVTIAQTPEPSSLLLLGTGAFGLLGPVHRKLIHHWK